MKKIKEAQAPCPQCDAPFNAQHYQAHFLDRRTRRIIQNHPDWDPDKCGRHASYVIDGKNLCSNHAGQAAIQKLIALQEKGVIE